MAAGPRPASHGGRPLLLVLSFLELPELLTAATVCRQWAQASRHVSLWANVDFSSASPTTVSDALVDRVLRLHPGAGRVCLSFCSRLTNASLESIIRHRPNLVALELEGQRNVTDAGVLAIAVACRTLQSLDLSGCIRLTTSGLISLLDQAPSLEAVALSGLLAAEDKVVAAAARKPRLRRLCLNGCSKISSAALEALVARAGSTLRELQLGYCDKLTDSVVDALVIHSPQLESLSLYGCLQLTDRAVAALARLGALRRLDLSQCRQVGDAGVVALASSSMAVSPLQWLNLYDCPLVTDASLAAIGGNCPSLAFLGLFGLSRVSPRAVEALLSSHGALRRLEVGGAPIWTPREIAALQRRFGGAVRL